MSVSATRFLLLLAMSSLAASPCLANEPTNESGSGNCHAFERSMAGAEGNMRAATRALIKLKETVGDVETHWEEETADIAVSLAEVNRLVHRQCRSQLSHAADAVEGLLSSSRSFVGDFNAKLWWARWRDKLRELRIDLQAAEIASADCLPSSVETRLLQEGKV